MSTGGVEAAAHSRPSRRRAGNGVCARCRRPDGQPAQHRFRARDGRRRPARLARRAPGPATRWTRRSAPTGAGCQRLSARPSGQPGPSPPPPRLVLAYVPSALRRRPSAALVIALLALFVAVGGPAEAARLIGSKRRKNRSLKTEDLSRKAVKTLQTTPRRSVGERQLRNGGVTTRSCATAPSRRSRSRRPRSGPISSRPARWARASCAPARRLAQIADGVVTGAKVADGSLDARDTGALSGRFRVSVPAVEPRECWSGEPVGSRPSRPGATSRATSCSRRRTAPGRSARWRSPCAARPAARASCSPVDVTTVKTRRSTSASATP